MLEKPHHSPPSKKKKSAYSQNFKDISFSNNSASKIGLAINCICTFWGLKADIKHLLHYCLATQTASL